MKKRILIVSAALLMTMAMMAQNMTSSPFSRYAYGDMNENVPVAYRSMGGVGFGMRSNHAINPAQPASYTSIDTLTFMFDVAASATWSRYRDVRGMRNKANGNLEYVTMQFPLYKRWIAMSVGLLPYSSVGYDISLSDSINSDYHFTKSYTGTGNISQVYGGLSFNILNWFAFGANVYYMWGDLDRMRTLTFTESDMNPTVQDEILSVSNVRFRAGAQLFHTFGKHAISLGAVFEPKLKLHSDLILIETQSEDSIPIYQGGWQLPMVWGLGGSYVWDHRLTLAFDFEQQYMSDALYNGLPGKDSGLQNRKRFAFGAEYRHNPMGRKYAERMMWRAGLSVQDEYLISIGAPRISASIGIGFPLFSVGTVVNLGIEYTHRGISSKLEDNGFRFTIGASIAENWFFKRKL